MPKTDSPKTDIAYPTIYNWNGRLNEYATNAVWVKFDHINRNISKVIE